MSFKDRLKSFAITAQSSDIIAKITTIFALVYHAAALTIFYRLGITPMFHFNIFSVVFFAVCTILILPGKIKDVTPLYLISYIEVVLHQVFAEYYIGAAACFHYFILLMGIMAFLVIIKHLNVAIILGIVSSVIFVILESLQGVWIPQYFIDSKIIIGIRILNISLGILVLLILVVIFVFMSFSSEQNLEEQVDEKTERITTLQNHIIISLASLVENRDADTGEHIQRTSAYVEIIARKAFEEKLYPEVINEEFISLLKRAAPMHDIGKIVVADSVLKKPARLTVEEFNQMKLHTTEGGRIIAEVVGISDDKDYLLTAIDVATGHHERWDGTGYPSGLKADNIPVSARIMAIADVFDALVSPRCYKEPMPKEQAYKIIQEESGTHFDPDLVEIFMSQKDKIEEVLRIYTK